MNLKFFNIIIFCICILDVAILPFCMVSNNGELYINVRYVDSETKDNVVNYKNSRIRVPGTYRDGDTVDNDQVLDTIKKRSNYESAELLGYELSSSDDLVHDIDISNEYKIGYMTGIRGAYWLDVVVSIDTTKEDLKRINIFPNYRFVCEKDRAVEEEQLLNILPSVIESFEFYDVNYSYECYNNYIKYIESFLDENLVVERYSTLKTLEDRDCIMYGKFDITIRVNGKYLKDFSKNLNIELKYTLVNEFDVKVDINQYKDLIDKLPKYIDTISTVNTILAKVNLENEFIIYNDLLKQYSCVFKTSLKNVNVHFSNKKEDIEYYWGEILILVESVNENE